AEMLRLVQLQGFEPRRPPTMSGGQQQRVALARVLATSPKLVLLDEPLSALDAKLREELRLELKQILSAVGSTTIVVTHDQDEAMSLADRIIVMNRGCIEQEGTPDEIYAEPRTSFVAGFIGRANWFSGRLGKGPDGAFVTLTTEAGSTLRMRAPQKIDDGKWRACVRPERMILTRPDAKSDGRSDNLVSGNLVDIVSLGGEIHYVVEGADGRLLAVEPNRGGPRVNKGERVGLSFQPEDCVAFPLAEA
ncbi:MAG: ABC transporter ATP-binding protein, partial [Hyphomicrobiales bacterium]|nr:ABC transporter ATP-binding protein [Hyphomicrobiales bacterium]